MMHCRDRSPGLGLQDGGITPDSFSVASWTWRRAILLVGLVIILLSLAFAQVIVAFREWYLWDLRWLDPLADLACIIPLFCKIGFVRYFLFALAAVVLAMVLFALASRATRSMPVGDLGVLEPSCDLTFKSVPAAAVLGGAAGVEIAVLWFIFQRQLPPVALWALATILASAGLLIWDRISGRPGLMSARDWLFAFSFYAFPVSGAFVGAGRLGEAGLAALSALIALGFSLFNRGGQPDFLWDRKSKIILLLLGLVIFAFGAHGLNQPRYAVVGDEWSFFVLGRAITRGTLQKHFLTGLGNYGMHPIFSSHIHAASMRIWGENNYGWRISNILLLSWSALSFYIFVRLFSSDRLALLAVAFYSVSHYLLSFSKIGYNNIQALWPVCTALAFFALALRRGSVYGIWLAGVITGFGFYVFALGRFAGPLLIAALFVYQFPVSRWRWLYWLVFLGGLFIIALPIATESGTSDVLLQQTILHSSIADTPAEMLVQFRNNSLYALFSFLTSRKNTHFVFGPHVDPVTSSFVALGGAALIMAWRRTRMAIWVLVLFALAVLFLGGLTQYDYPPNTRMFMLVPFYALLAAVGCDLFGALLERATCRSWLGRVFCVGSVVIAFLLNLHIIYRIYPQRRALVQECLLIEMLQKIERGERERLPIFVVRPVGDHYDLVRVLLTAYELRHVEMGVLTPEEIVDVFARRECAAEKTMFLIPSQIPNREMMLQIVHNSCPGTEIMPLLDEAEAYHYEQIVAHVAVPSHVGLRLTPWEP